MRNANLAQKVMMAVIAVQLFSGAASAACMIAVGSSMLTSTGDQNTYLYPLRARYPDDQPLRVSITVLGRYLIVSGEDAEIASRQFTEMTPSSRLIHCAF